MEGQARNICIQMNSVTPWISAHQDTFEYSDGFILNFYAAEIVN